MQRASSALLVLLFAEPLAAQSLVPGVKAVECQTTDLEAEVMTCDDETCVLEGAVRLRCADLRLSADRLTIQLGENQRFAGAVAEGDVTMIQGTTVLTCRRLALEPDRIHGRIDAATVRVKATPGTGGAPPSGRDTAVLRGDIERQGDRDYTLLDAELTLCDCGQDPPSWRITASRIDATLNDRAFLTWPVFRPNLFGVLEVPLPMPPASIPLTGRAFGLLPPRPTFLEGRPMLDLPIFVPIGRSYDLTFTPGLRMGWAPPLALAPDTWGAPRLGVRGRYAPSADVEGTLELSWTHDAGQWAARNRIFAAAVGGLEAARDDTTLPDAQRQLAERDLEELQRRGARVVRVECPEGQADCLEVPDAERGLVDRLALSATHRSSLTDTLDWTLAGTWHSDDRYLYDFGTSLREQTASYLPARTQLLWHQGPLAAAAAADFFTLLGNDRTDASNVRGAERETMHRGPTVHASLSPVRLLPGLYGDAQAGFARYGRWSAGAEPTGSDDLSVLLVSNAAGGLSWAGLLGPIGVRARGGADVLWSQRDRAASRGQTMLTLAADADLKLARRFGATTHALTPRLAYRGLPLVDGDVEGERRFDPRLDRREQHQLLLALDQAVWRAGRATATLTLQQPFDLVTGELLQSQAELGWSDVLRTKGRVRVAAAPGTDDLLRELTGEISTTLGPVDTGASYARWLPTSDRLLRTLYELAAPRGRVGESSLPVHTLGLSLRLRAGDAFTLSYGTEYLLPRQGGAAPVPGQEDLQRDRFTEHRGTMTYNSPCQCWGLTLYAAFPSIDPWDNYRWGALLAVGGYTVGK